MKVKSIDRRPLVLLALPALLCVVLIVGHFSPNPIALWSGIGIGGRPASLPGMGTIDPAAGIISIPLGIRAALDIMSGALPLWNHYEGLGTPLLGEMQSAALFPPTLLLLLPHGPLIEHFVLQAIAGLGTFLFLRRFGLGNAAALAGAILFEFNGIFAWLRNAIFNPVPFLPWLFYVVETLFVAARSSDPFRLRLPAICLGALAASLALYAGFPEVVYFYSLLLFCWSIFRALSLPRRRIAFLGDLLGVAILAALIAAPLLIAFGAFLSEASVGGHTGEGFRDNTLAASGLLAYLMPYVYGPIFAAPQDVVGNAFWFNIGGYLGVMPLLLGVAGLSSRWREPGCWLLAGWALVAVSVTHGLPGVHNAFMHIPLAKLAMFGRYLNASWVFCFVVLSAVFIDEVPRLTPVARRRISIIVVGGFFISVSGAAVLAEPQLSALWRFRHGHRLALISSFGVAVVLALGALLSLRSRHARRLLSALSIGEATLAFLLPFASYPQISSFDRGLVAFLREHVGLQRTAVASRTGLMPNYGSAFGFALLNYDDLPVPLRTATFVHTNLDPGGNIAIFRPDGRVETPAERELSRTEFITRIPSYADAGVRYLLAKGPDFFAKPAYGLMQTAFVAVPLRRALPLTLTVPSTAAQTLRALVVTIGTYGGAANGSLQARICQQGRCTEGTTTLANAPDNLPLTIPFEAPISLDADRHIQLTFTGIGGDHDVALWSQPPEPGSASKANLLPVVGFVDVTTPEPIFQSATTTVFELSRYRPYASADGCNVSASTHDRMVAQCSHASQLVRLEVFMPGWSATVNGTKTEVRPIADLFQGTDLPVGTSVISFDYAPTGLRFSFPLALLTLFFCLGILTRHVLNLQRSVRRIVGGRTSGSG